MSGVQQFLEGLSNGLTFPWPWWVSVFLILPIVDCFNVLAYFKRPLALAPEIAADNDYTIIIPLFGHPRYFARAAELEAYKANTILSVNCATEVMAEAADAWEKAGWRVARPVISDREAPNELIAAALPLVETSYALRLDGDSVPLEDPGRAIAILKRRQIDCASVIVLPSARRTVAEKLQHLEYGIAMRTRTYRPWLTSGACMILRTDLYHHVQRWHSNFFLGEDIEVGRIALQAGARVDHVGLTVVTDVPETLRALFRQRRGWWCGSFRLSVVNIDKNVQVPGFLLYSSIFIWLLWPLKIASIISAPQVIPLLMVEYMLLTALVNWPVRSRWMLAMPAFALVQVVVMPAFGIARYINLVRKTGRTGRLRIGWTPRRAGRRRGLASDSLPVGVGDPVLEEV